MAELIIRNARLVLPEGIIRGELAIDNGLISEISRVRLPKGAEEIDAEGKLVMPGAIDAHAHIHDPRYPRREDFRSGTAAAAAGGVTSVISMPLDAPRVTPEEIREIIKVGQKSSLIDFALHAGNMTANAIEHMHSVAELGIRSFKVFTCAPYGVDDATLRKIMLMAKNIDCIVFVHAEDDGILSKNIQRLLKAGRKDPLAHAESRPNEAEEKAIKRVIGLTGQTGCSLHLAHVTTRGGVEQISKARAEHVRLTAETCPHYLLFTKEDMQRQGPYLKVNPALKTSEDCAALWDGLANGTIDIVATDHAPGTRKEKEIGWKDIWAAQTGIPGIETMLSLMLSEGFVKGRLVLERLVDALCSKPAKIFGLYPRKGVIREGSDADLVIVDLKKESTIKADKLHYKVGWTPYEGMKVKGMPVMTISRGMVIAEEGKVLGKPGRGQFLGVRRASAG